MGERGESCTAKGGEGRAVWNGARRTRYSSGRRTPPTSRRCTPLRCTLPELRKKGDAGAGDKEGACGVLLDGAGFDKADGGDGDGWIRWWRRQERLNPMVLGRRMPAWRTMTPTEVDGTVYRILPRWTWDRRIRWWRMLELILL